VLIGLLWRGDGLSRRLNPATQHFLALQRPALSYFKIIKPVHGRQRRRVVQQNSQVRG
jgi:hypothetical protein